MPRFYVEGVGNAQKDVAISGEDVNHIRNVLRLSVGDEITVCDGAGLEYLCKISAMERDLVRADIVDVMKNAAELPCKITLFQGMPKSDKLEFIIQKAVELGVYSIVPVLTDRTVVKIEDRKRDKKIERYNAIAKSAAEQSGRGVVPEVLSFMSFREALSLAKDYDMNIIPYENAEGISHARSVMEQAAMLGEGERLGIFIGPEGGFTPEEIELAEDMGAHCITLGNRILRTETAGLAVLSILMFSMEA